MTDPLAITLGDPRGIGPEITARALAQPLEAEITLVGADDQIAGIPAERKVAVGTWGHGSGDTGPDRKRAASARAASPATRSKRLSSSRSAAKSTPSSPPPPTSMPSISRAFPIPVTPNGWPTSPATWMWP